MVSDMRDGNAAQAVKLLDHAQELLVFTKQIIDTPSVDLGLCDYGLGFVNDEVFRAVSDAIVLLEKDEEGTEE